MPNDAKGPDSTFDLNQEGAMKQDSSSSNRSSFRLGRVEVKYEVREPSPGRWNAVGVLYFDGSSFPASDQCPMVVGVGPTYYEAVGDLLARVLGRQHPDLQNSKFNHDIGNIAGNSSTVKSVTEDLMASR